MYAIMVCHIKHIPAVIVYFDSHYAHGMANALYAPNVHVTLAAILAGLKTLLDTVATTKWFYEPSHEKRPFNEFVDVASKHCRTRAGQYDQITSPAHGWAAGDCRLAEWGFLFWASPSIKASYPLKWHVNHL